MSKQVKINLLGNRSKIDTSSINLLITGYNNAIKRINKLEKIVVKLQKVVIKVTEEEEVNKKQVDSKTSKK